MIDICQYFLFKRITRAVANNIIPISIRKIDKLLFNFPARNTDVGPSAPPMIETAVFSFTFITLPKIINKNPIVQVTISNIFFTIYILSNFLFDYKSNCIYLKFSCSFCIQKNTPILLLFPVAQQVFLLLLYIYLCT